MLVVEDIVYGGPMKSLVEYILQNLDNGFWKNVDFDHCKRILKPYELFVLKIKKWKYSEDV